MLRCATPFSGFFKLQEFDGQPGWTKGAVGGFGRLSRLLLPMNDYRRQIILDFAKWTALSALRSGTPVKSRAEVYRLLDGISFADLLLQRSAIKESEFDRWHEKQTQVLCKQSIYLPVGWGAKLININLKTAAYVGDAGHETLRRVIHPPIDSMLLAGLRLRFRHRPDILADACCVRRIKDISTYATYRRIIAGCRVAANSLGCSLLEVDHLWLGTATSNPRQSSAKSRGTKS